MVRPAFAFNHSKTGNLTFTIAIAIQTVYFSDFASRRVCLVVEIDIQYCNISGIINYFVRLREVSS